MAVPPAPGLDTGLTSSDPDTAPDQHTAPPRRRNDTFRLALLAVLVLVLLAATAVAVHGIATAGREVLGLTSPQTQQVQRDREDAMAQARQFMLRGQTYGPEGLDDQGRLAEYRALVEEVVTPKFFTQFEETATVAEQLVEQTGVERSAEVLGTGVETIDEDSATVLVAGEISMTMKDEKGEASAPTRDLFRVVIEMVKVDGEWLVDDFQQASEAAQ